jgi:hypothetical protein
MSAEFRRGGAREADDTVLGRVVGAGPGEAALARDGTRVDDRAAAATQHHRHDVTQAQEHAAQVHRDQAVELRDVVLVDRRELAFGAGVVEQPVDASEGVDRGLHVALHVVIAADVGADAHDARSERGYRCFARRETLAVNVDDEQVGALLGEHAGGSKADAAGAARDDHRLAREDPHGAPSWRFSCRTASRCSGCPCIRGSGRRGRP